MAVLIKERRAVADSWRLLKHGEDGALAAVPASGDVIVPLALWLEQRDALRARIDRAGVWLDSHEDPAALAGDIARLPLIAVNFPKFGDGRGYSIARLLRERYGFKGELRAIGEVARDLLFYMAAVGFDAFALREGEELEEAQRAFADFSESYQASVTQPQPLFRRRLAAGRT
jgi:uncharacterized protein (DUF934 family)